MLAVVESVGKITVGKFNDTKNQKIIFKCIDKQCQCGLKHVSLNINPDDKMVYDKWKNYINVGDFLDISLTYFNNRWYVDKYKGCRLVKKIIQVT